MYYSLLVKRKDGLWWYCPGDTVDRPEMVEGAFKDKYCYNERKILKHYQPLYQLQPTYTYKEKAYYTADGMLRCLLN